MCVESDHSYHFPLLSGTAQYSQYESLSTEFSPGHENLLAYDRPEIIRGGRGQSPSLSPATCSSRAQASGNLVAFLCFLMHHCELQWHRCVCVCVCACVCACVLVTQLCLTLCDPTDSSLPGSPVHRISQARVLECVVSSFSRGSCQPRDQTRVSHITGRFITILATREAQWHRYTPVNKHL